MCVYICGECIANSGPISDVYYYIDRGRLTGNLPGISFTCLLSVLGWSREISMALLVSAC